MKNRYVIGMDYGTLSGRALLMDADTGEELAESVLEYPHGVMSDTLPDGTALPAGSAVQDPMDYVLVLQTVIRDAMKKADVSPEDVVGVGIDFTAATVLPVDRECMPLCAKEAYFSHPKAYATLWKDHTAAPQAAKIDAVCARRNAPYLSRCGGKCSAENGLAKILCILQTDPQVYRAADQIVEAGDWITKLLCGTPYRGFNIASGKEFWCRDLGGYPSDDFMADLDPEFRNVVSEKLGGNNAVSYSPRFGTVTKRGAELSGLCEGTPVAAPFIDGAAPVLSCGISTPGKMAMIVGTSLCHYVLSDRFIEVPGMFSVSVDGLLPGYTTYEAGQSSCGDHLAWYLENMLPASYQREADERGVGIHVLLREKAAALGAGGSGLLCLEWFNGNRSVLNDADLSGVLMGLTLRTKPEAIYRALLEGTVFGTRKILERMCGAGLKIDEIVACGGIARKDPLMMQMFADITGRTVRICASAQAPARASAMFAAIAAGIYPDIPSCCEKLTVLSDTVYRPDPVNQAKYEQLYALYAKMYDEFGTKNGVLKELRRIAGER